MAPAAPAVAPPAPAPVPAQPPEVAAVEPPTDTHPVPRPNVRLSFLVYSQYAERRSVVLVIEGGGLTTLHEGERAGNIEVARILPDSVEIKYQGRMFTVHPRD